MKRQRLLMVFLAASFIFSLPAIAAQKEETGEKHMNREITAGNNREKLPDASEPSALAATDPELAAIRDSLVFGEIAAKGSLTDKQRELLSLAALTAIQTMPALEAHVHGAIKAGASPVEIKESIYQCAPYVGFPRVEAAIATVNEVFAKNGIKMPLESQATVNGESRLGDGLAVQKKIFGAANIEAMQEKAPKGQKDIVVNYLSAFCFGDFYTRKGLDLKMRELVTFSAIVALGGCDPQAKAHAAANISAGNSKQNLVDALAAMLPYIGFPRTLNGLAAVNAAIPEK